MIYLDLFLGFLKVGCFAFGGAYAAIPLIREVVLAHGWIGEEMLADMIAVSESTPGPIMVNLATYVGNVKGGLFGAFVATAAVVLPSFFIILLLMLILREAMKNRYVKAVFGGLKPGVAGIILAVGCVMLLHNLGFFRSGAVFDPRAVIALLILAAVWIIPQAKGKKKMSPIAFIGISAAAGIVIWGVF